MSNNYQVAIIGAGISGVSLARLLQNAGIQCVVLEKNDDPGGCISTHHFAKDNFVEMGAHSIYNSYGALLALLEEEDLRSLVRNKGKHGYKFYRNGQFRSITSQIHWPELLCSIPRLFTEKKEDLSIEQYYSRILGKNNYKKMFSHAANCILSQDISEFPADFLFKKKPREKSLPRNFAIKGGLSVLFELLSKDIPLRTHCRVSHIIKEKGNFILRTSDESAIIKAEMIVPTLTPTASAQLLSELFPDLSASLQKLGETTVESVGISVPAACLSDIPPMGGLIGINQPFFSVISMDNFPQAGQNGVYRNFCFHFRPQRLNMEEKKKVILNTLRLDADDLWAIHTHQSHLPRVNIGLREIISEIDRLSTPQKGCLLTGSYFGGASINDCVQRSREVANQIIAHYQ